ncbi:MAG: PD40 domain-containing protein [Anaerolineae bacterium]|nr:PD40 domain-containing protein [Anaerolineae bacterium]
MLIRAYRLADKFGVVTLKSSVVIGQYGLHGFGLLVGTFVRLVFGQILLGVLGFIARVVRLIFRGLYRVVSGVLGLAGIGAKKAAMQAAGAVGSSTTGVMARRAARAELQGTVTEDPLRVQNRALSLFSVALLAVLVVVILWATNPARNSGGLGAVNNPAGNAPFIASGLTPNATNAPVLLSTQVPTATALPPVLEARGSIAYVGRENGQSDIFALSIGNRNPIRLTNSPFDERDPAWSPDGQRLAYASRQDGNWELYIYDVASGTTTRMTYDLSFQGAPRWSPDGLFLVYESYQGDNLDIYVVPVDGSQPAQRVTDHAAPDFSPAWSPDGRRIAFVSWRDGNQDIYIFSLDNPVDSASVNITNTAERQEDYPAWSPDGRFLAYSAVDAGLEKVFVKASDNPQSLAQVVAQGRQPAWSPDGTSLIYAVDSAEGTQFVASPFTDAGVTTLVVGVNDAAGSPVWTGRPLPANLVSSGGLGSGVPQPLFIEQVASADRNGLFGLGTLLSIEVSRSKPYLSDKVNDSFNALREQALEMAGWDFLGRLDDAFWDLNHLPEPGEERRNWYMTGRAFGISRNLTAGFPPQIELIREDIGINTFWRVYVRVNEDAPSGQLGEPLRRMPWDMLSRSSGDVQAYDQGGKLKTQMPSGYYIDFTQLAVDYGWQRGNAGNDWRANVNSINYWLFLKTEGLSWYQAMLELYTEPELGGFAATATPNSGTG